MFAAVTERVNINLFSERFLRFLRRNGSLSSLGRMNWIRYTKLKIISQQIFTKCPLCTEPTILGAGGIRANKTD